MYARTIASIRALAKALGRDHSNVHADVTALIEAGRLELSGKRPARRLRRERNADRYLTFQAHAVSARFNPSRSSTA